MKSTVELKAVINKFKLGRKEHELVDKINDNLKTYMKNMLLYILYLHNTTTVKGKPQYEIKLDSLEKHRPSTDKLSARTTGIRNLKMQSRSFNIY